MAESGPRRIAPATPLPVRTFTARNAALDSENKIHDDREARRYGYAGGLVPGVTLYAYLTQLALDLYGDAWLLRGTADCAFRRPVYEGQTVRCEGETVPVAAGAPALAVRLAPAGGPVCADGTFALADDHARLFADVPAGAPPRKPLPPLLPDTVPLGVPLAPLESAIDADAAAAYAAATDDPCPWFRGPSPFGGPLVPPGWLAARQAPLLRQNFRFGPSIHTRSVIHQLAPAFAGHAYITTGVIRETFERNGNHYLVLDAQTRDAAGRTVCQVRHTSIFSVRRASNE